MNFIEETLSISQQFWAFFSSSFHQRLYVQTHYRTKRAGESGLRYRTVQEKVHRQNRAAKKKKKGKRN